MEIRTLLSALAAGLLFTAFTGCSVVPESGRQRIILVSPQEMTASGLQAFDQIKKETPVSRDARLQKRIQRIGERIARAVGRDLPDAQWEFVVFDDPKTINAFALPGGKVGVYTGLINLASGDDEIAAVIGHEIAHVSSQHGAERVSQQMLAGAAGFAATELSKNSSNREGWLLATAGLSGGTLLYYSREHETEADLIGLRFTAGAGYDPRAAVSFWEKMAAKNSGSETWKWISTHPPTSERIENLKRIAPELVPLYEASRNQGN